MSKDQGIVGALDQYWTLEPKARLHRRNTYFDDVQVTNTQALRVGIVATVVAVAIIGFWSMLGVIL